MYQMGTLKCSSVPALELLNSVVQLVLRSTFRWTGRRSHSCTKCTTGTSLDHLTSKSTLRVTIGEDSDRQLTMGHR